MALLEFPISYAAILADVAEEYGANRNQLLHAVKIKASDLADANQHISAEQLQCLIVEAKHLTNESALCLYFGQHLTLTAHGVLGYALMSCHTIQQAIDILMKYHRLLFNDITLSAHQDSKHIEIAYQHRSQVLLSHDEDCELFFSGVISSIKHLLHRDDFECEIYLDYPAPPHAAQYQALMGNAIYFDSDTCKVSIDKQWLNEKPVYANPVMLQMYERQCDQLLAQMEASTGLEEKVRSYLIASQQFASLQQTAEHFHMSTRTFRRRLEEENTSFQDILDSVRQQLAETYLRDPSLSVQHTAELLGFHDVSNFRRAFIRWTGISPAEFKKHL